MPKLSLTRHLAALGVGACLLVGGAAGAAQAAAAGILPPRNPAANCDRGGGLGSAGVATIDACRALENVGPLKLPSNWNALTMVEQGFVLLDLERVNRGLPPIVGLSPALNALASSGATNGVDPSFPAGGFLGGGAIWAEVPSVLAADQLWMYDDGVGGNNADCSASGASGCWGHRDIILWDRLHGALVAGGGYSSTGGSGSFAYVVLAGYSTASLSFTWNSELKYFAEKPAVEPLGKGASVRRRHRAGHRKTRRRPHRVHAASSDGGPTITIG
ncbi:MAG: hypothetical protein KGL15_11555 [Acidobacteriota bacterium]|nr:hypothetical protein [Acidobacteriota bacterium]